MVLSTAAREGGATEELFDEDQLREFGPKLDWIITNDSSTLSPMFLVNRHNALRRYINETGQAAKILGDRLVKGWIKELDGQASRFAQTNDKEARRNAVELFKAVLGEVKDYAKAQNFGLEAGLEKLY